MQSNHREWSRRAKRVLRWLAWLLTALLGLAGALLAAAWLSVPRLDDLKTSSPEHTSYMRVQATERGLADGGPKLVPLSLEQVSPLLGCAVVKAEDRTFFTHHGLVWERVREAIRDELEGKRPAGGSTITQQLARNLFLSPERSLWRKLREAFIARELESELGKRRILELYLQSIEWGDGIWGAQAAAEHWVGKPASTLGPFQASFLAALIAAPRDELSGSNLARVSRVQTRVLWQLSNAGVITHQDAQRAEQASSAFVQELARGSPLSSAMPPAAATIPTLSWSEVLSSGCGLARELGGHR